MPACLRDVCKLQYTRVLGPWRRKDLGMRAGLPSIFRVSHERSCHWASFASDDRLCESIAPSSCQTGTKSHLCERPFIIMQKEFRVGKAWYYCNQDADELLSVLEQLSSTKAANQTQTGSVPASNGHCIGTDTNAGASLVRQWLNGLRWWM